MNLKEKLAQRHAHFWFIEKAICGDPKRPFGTAEKIEPKDKFYGGAKVQQSSIHQGFVTLTPNLFGFDSPQALVVPIGAPDAVPEGKWFNLTPEPEKGVPIMEVCVALRFVCDPAADFALALMPMFDTVERIFIFRQLTDESVPLLINQMQLALRARREKKKAAA